MRRDRRFRKVEQLAFTVSQAAKMLGVSPNTLRKKSDRGTIPAYRDENNARVFLRRDLEAYLESLPRWESRDTHFRGKSVVVASRGKEAS